MNKLENKMEDQTVEQSDNTKKINSLLNMMKHPGDYEKKELQRCLDITVDATMWLSEMCMDHFSPLEVAQASYFMHKARYMYRSGKLMEAYDRFGAFVKLCLKYADIRDCWYDLRHCLHDFKPPKVVKKFTRFVVCYCCGEVGHKKFECPHRHHVCSLCHKTGHLEARCWSKTKHCHGCGEAGHYVVACPKQKRVRCYCCGKLGHIKRNCPHRHDQCGSCGRVGHTAETCWHSGNKAVTVPDQIQHDDNKEVEEPEREQPTVVNVVNHLHEAAEVLCDGLPPDICKLIRDRVKFVLSTQLLVPLRRAKLE